MARIAFGVAALAVDRARACASPASAAAVGEHIAKLRISGLITGDDATSTALRAIGKSRRARA